MKKQHVLMTVILAVATTTILTVLGFVLLKKPATTLQTIAPETRDVAATVHTPGMVTAGQAVDLSFVRGGRIKTLAVKVGDQVHAGQLLAELDNTVESAQIAQARAALAQRAAGNTPTQIAVLQAAADAAKADLEKTKTDTAAQIATAQSAVDLAQNNLKMSGDNAQSQIVVQAYQNAGTSMVNAVSTMNNALIQADLILGVDSSANASYANILSVLDTSKLSNAKMMYATTKSQVADVAAVVAAVNPNDPSSTDATLGRVQDALTQTNTLLNAVTDVLHATVGNNVYLSQADLNTKIAGIQQTQTSVQGQRSAVIAAQQGIVNAKNSLSSANLAYAKAQQDLANAKQSAAGAIKIKQSLVDQANANVANAKAPVRGVDLGPLYAAVSVAGAAYEQTQLLAPIDGVITKKTVDIGAIASPNVPVYSIVNNGTLQTEALVSESDMARVKVGSAATVTLDAFGPGVPFDATVVKIDPAPTTQNGVTGYRLTLQFAKIDERIKVGMAANITINIDRASGVLALPTRSIVQQGGKNLVFVLADGATQPESREITVGVKGDDGYWQVVSGVSASDRVVNFGN